MAWYKRKISKKSVARKRKGFKKIGSVARLSKQVKNLQMICKPEKKYEDVNQNTISYLGQYDTVGVDGAYYAGLNPVVNAGTQVGARTGNKIQLTSAYLQIQLRQMSSTVNPIRYRYWIMLRKSNTPSDITSTSAYNDYFLTNPFSGVRDYFANPDMETMKNYKCLARGKGIVRADPATGSQAMTAFIKRPLKLNFPQTFESPTATSPACNKMYLFVQCDNGTIADNTGLQMEYTCRFWYTDM